MENVYSLLYIASDLDIAGLPVRLFAQAGGSVCLFACSHLRLFAYSPVALRGEGLGLRLS